MKLFSNSIVHIPLQRDNPERDKYTEMRIEFERKHHELRIEFERKHHELRIEFERKHHELRTEFEKKYAEFEQIQTIKYTELAHTMDVLQYTTLKLLSNLEMGHFDNECNDAKRNQ